MLRLKVPQPTAGCAVRQQLQKHFVLQRSIAQPQLKRLEISVRAAEDEFEDADQEVPKKKKKPRKVKEVFAQALDPDEKESILALSKEDSEPEGEILEDGSMIINGIRLTPREVQQLEESRKVKKLDFQSPITNKRPYRPLTHRFVRWAGHDRATGRIRQQGHGAGHIRNLREIDFIRNKINMVGVVESVEYDPNRSAKIALIKYQDGERRYILYVRGMRVGDPVQSGENAPISLGNALPLEKIPIGTLVHNIEDQPGSGAIMVRAGGTSARIVAKNEGFVILRLPSKEVRMVKKRCWATIGMVGDPFRDRNLPIGKAGRNRWLGIRPTNRGSSKNACDHPYGGGKSKAPLGMPDRTKGKKQRKRNAFTNRFILSRPKSGNRTRRVRK